MPRKQAMPEGYNRLWAAATVSALGDGVRTAAIPLLAAAVTRDPVAISVVTAAGFLPWPVLGLLGGAAADRFDRRRAMWVVNTFRALLMAAATAVLLLIGSLPIAALATLAFLIGTAETVYDNAAVGYLPQLLPKGALARGNARLYTSQMAATQLIGPPVGGILFVFGPVIPLTINAVSFAVSAALISGLPKMEKQPVRAQNLRQDILEGLTWLWRSPALRSLAVVTTALGAVSGALLAMLIVYSRDQLEIASVGYGLLLSAFAVGSIAGGLLVPRLIDRLPLRGLLTTCVLISTGVFGGLAATTDAIAAGVLLGCLGLAVATWNITSVTVRQRIVPNHLLGRVSSAYRATTLTFTTAGALSAGVLTEATSVSMTMWACAGLTLGGLALGSRGLREVDSGQTRPKQQGQVAQDGDSEQIAER